MAAKLRGTMSLLRRRRHATVAATVAMAGVIAVSGLAAAPAQAAVVSARPAAAPAITWQHRGEINMTDRCGGAKGWVQWSGSDIQTYGDVWENASSCGGPGYHYVELYYIRAGVQFNWSSEEAGQYAEPGQTVGFNSGVETGDANVSNIEVFLCSTEADACNAMMSF